MQPRKHKSAEGPRKENSNQTLILAAWLCGHLALFRCRSKGTNVKLLKPIQAHRISVPHYSLTSVNHPERNKRNRE